MWTWTWWTCARPVGTARGCRGWLERADASRPRRVPKGRGRTPSPRHHHHHHPRTHDGSVMVVHRSRSQSRTTLANHHPLLSSMEARGSCLLPGWWVPGRSGTSESWARSPGRTVPARELARAATKRRPRPSRPVPALALGRATQRGRARIPTSAASRSSSSRTRRRRRCLGRKRNVSYPGSRTPPPPVSIVVLCVVGPGPPVGPDPTARQSKNGARQTHGGGRGRGQ